MTELEKDRFLVDIVGIDITSKGLVLSFMSDDMNDPMTLMDISGEKTRFIPDCIAKEKSLGRWHSAEAAIRANNVGDAYLVTDLYDKAYNKETVQIEGRSFLGEELFATFLRRTLDENGFDVIHLKKLVISVFEVDIRTIELFNGIGDRLNIDRDILTIIDHKEAFIYYTLSQNQNIYAHDVALFEYDNDKIVSYILKRNQKTRPQLVDITKDSVTIGDKRDADFASYVEKIFNDRVITSVFLIGKGFEGDWMKESVKVLCKNRRVFFGDNLFCKGACFTGRIRLGRRPFAFIYIGDHEMKKNLSLKVNDRNDMSFFTLVEAGENWYETGKECEVILDGSPQFECWIQSPETRKANIQLIELKELPRRENRTTRLRITAKPLSDTEVRIIIKDLGFGDIAPSSGKTWEHLIDMGDWNGRADSL